MSLFTETFERHHKRTFQPFSQRQNDLRKQQGIKHLTARELSQILEPFFCGNPMYDELLHIFDVESDFTLELTLFIRLSIIEIYSHLYAPKETFALNSCPDTLGLQQVIDEFFSLNIPIHLIEIISMMTVEEGVSWQKSFFDHESNIDCTPQFEWAQQNCQLSWPYPRGDYLTPITTPLPQDSLVAIDVLITGKYDEMWLGVLPNFVWSRRRNLVREWQYYYGGRESTITNRWYADPSSNRWVRSDGPFGSLKNTKGETGHPVDYYRRGDWVTCLIDTKEHVMTFWKNSQFIGTTTIPPGQLVFAGVVDRANDGFYIEQFCWYGQLPMERVVEESG